MSPVEELINALVEPSQADYARQTLLQLGRDALESLLRALPGADTKLAWEIINLLAKFRDPRAVPSVAEYLRAENGALRVAAAQTLGRIGHRSATTPLLRALDEDRQSGATIWIVQALGRIGDFRATEPLLNIIQETDSPAVRYTAIEAVGLIGDPRAVGVVEMYVNDASHHVRTRAEIALARLRGRQYPETLSLSGT
jgi:HEAT repeat protein